MHSILLSFWFFRLFREEAGKNWLEAIIQYRNASDGRSRHSRCQMISRKSNSVHFRRDFCESSRSVQESREILLSRRMVTVRMSSLLNFLKNYKSRDVPRYFCCVYSSCGYDQVCSCGKIRVIGGNSVDGNEIPSFCSHSAGRSFYPI